MNVDDVMEELATAIATVDGLRVHDHAAKVVAPPMMLVPLPVIRFDHTYGRGMDLHEYDLTLLAGGWSARASRQAIGVYADGTGDQSVKATLEAYAWESCDTVIVKTVEFATITVAGVEYLGAVFATDVVGTGS